MRPLLTELRTTVGWRAIVAATGLALAAAVGAAVLIDTGSSDTASSDAESSDTGSRAGDDIGSIDDPGPIELTEPDLAAVTGIPFMVEDSDAETTIAERLDGRPMVVNFFASWCSPCIKEMPDFEIVSQELAGQVDVLGIAVTDRPEDAAGIVDSTGVTYPWGRDQDGDVAGTAGVFNMPTTLFIDADGVVVDAQPGAVDAERLRELIAEHLGVEA